MSYVSNSRLILNTQFTQQIRSKNFKTKYLWIVSGYMDTPESLKIPETKTHHVEIIYIWSDVILLVGITLFCDQGRKSESLEERRNIM